MLRRVIAVLCGALLALTLPRPGLCPLAWFVLAPFFYFLFRDSRSSLQLKRRSGEIKSAAIHGFLFGIGFYGTAIYWVYSTCRFAAIPIPAAVLAWTALTALMSLNWMAFAVLADAAPISFPAWTLPWTCAILWTGIEFAIGRWTPGLGMLLLEYTQWKYLSWIQAASLIGPHGLGFLIVLWNAALACAVVDFIRGGKLSGSTAKNWVVAGLLALSWWGYGTVVISHSNLQTSSGSRVAILQPNVDQYQKWDEHYADRIRGNFDELLGQAGANHPAVVVWPESSIPGWLDESENGKWISDWARRADTYFIVGAITREGSGGMKQYNSAAWVDPVEGIAGYYHKRRLVPFGEFVPLRAVFSRFVGILEQMGDLDPGPAEPAHFQSHLGRIGATICFEAMFPELTRRSAKDAQLLVNVTNDGWYKDTWAPYEHFYANIFRAVENRITVVRAANTGISGIIDPYGRVLAQLNINRRGTLEGALPPDPFPVRSFYARHGDWFGWLGFLTALLIIAACFKARGKSTTIGNGMHGIVLLSFLFLGCHARAQSPAPSQTSARTPDGAYPPSAAGKDVPPSPAAAVPDAVPGASAAAAIGTQAAALDPQVTSTLLDLLNVKDNTRPSTTDFTATSLADILKLGTPTGYQLRNRYIHLGVSLADTLAAAEDKRLKDQLIELARWERNPDIRAVALISLATRKEPAHFDFFREALDSGKTEIRFAALEALEIWDLPQAKDLFLKEARNDISPLIRVYAAQALYRRGTSEGLDIIREQLNSSDWLVRAMSAKYLGDLGVGDDYDLLLNRMTLEQHNDFVLAECAIGALKLFPKKQQ